MRDCLLILAALFVANVHGHSLARACTNQDIDILDKKIDGRILGPVYFFGEKGRIFVFRTATDKLYATWNAAVKLTPQPLPSYPQLSELIKMPTGNTIIVVAPSDTRSKLYLADIPMEKPSDLLLFFQTSDFSGRILSVHPHPNFEDWIAVVLHNNERNELWVTEDKGRSWVIQFTYLTKFQWVPNKYEGYILDFTHRDGNQQDKDPLRQRFLKFEFPTGRFAEIFAPEAAEFFAFGNVLGYSVLSSSNTWHTYISKDAGKQWKEAAFSINLQSGPPKVVGLSNNTIFVAVNHSSKSNLYIGDLNSGEFTQTLEDIYCGSAKCEFKQFDGLDGVIVANSGALGRIRSSISYDAGGSWFPITPNPLNATYFGCEDQNNCNINMKIAPETFIVQNSAPGVVLAVGNAGGVTNNQRNVFYSRDAGITWKVIRDGSHLVGMSSAGSVIMLLPNDKKTRTLYYTLDDSRIIQSCDFASPAQEDVSIDNIYQDDEHQYSQIVVSARRGEEDFLFVVDFFDVESSRKNCTEKDYEYWHPVDPVGDECILGKKIQYIRHKEGAECSSQYVAGPVVIDSACPCTAQDYECDLCFDQLMSINISSTLTCALAYDCAQDPRTKPMKCDGTWLRKTGYRLVPDSTCNVTSGLNLLATIESCSEIEPDTQSQSGPGPVIVVIAILVAAVFGAVGLLWVLSGTNTRVRKTLVRCLPEKYLRSVPSESAGYSSVMNIQYFEEQDNTLDTDNHRSNGSDDELYYEQQPREGDIHK